MENLKPGITKKLEETVSKEKTAARYGSGLVEVYATPAMIAFMEKTAMEAVLPYLPEGMNTVGTEVNIKHVKASPIGMKISCEATLLKVEGRRLEFTVRSWDEEGEIGSGTHSRHIIDMKKFMSKFHK